ncbi:uncharacterized protein [Symphalangus syndactylus]|uniref:uncharacterized protein n=1 Tax=Symphalangus syndactylus TaxID=9590 RepID=UPI003006F751
MWSLHLHLPAFTYSLSALAFNGPFKVMFLSLTPKSPGHILGGETDGWRPMSCLKLWSPDFWSPHFRTRTCRTHSSEGPSPPGGPPGCPSPRRAPASELLPALPGSENHRPPLTDSSSPLPASRGALKREEQLLLRGRRAPSSPMKSTSLHMCQPEARLLSSKALGPWVAPSQLTVEPEPGLDLPATPHRWPHTTHSPHLLLADPATAEAGSPFTPSSPPQGSTCSTSKVPLGPGWGPVSSVGEGACLVSFHPQPSSPAELGMKG